MILLCNLKLQDGRERRQGRVQIDKDDVLGLFAIGFVLIAHFSALILPIAIFSLQPGLDPIHTIAMNFLGHGYLAQLAQPTETVWWLLRVLIWMVLLSGPLRSICVLALTVILETPIFYECLQHCHGQTLSFRVLSRYDKFFRIRCFNVKGCAAALSACVAVAFPIQVHQRIMCFFGYKVLNPALYGLVVASTLIGDLLTYVLLTYGANLFEEASSLIENWRRELHLIRKPSVRRHIRRLLNHFRPVCFRCGDFGKLRRDTKKNYYSSLKDWFIDVMFMVQPSFN